MTQKYFNTKQGRDNQLKLKIANNFKDKSSQQRQ